MVVNTESPTILMKRLEVKGGYAELLRRYRWNWFCTLTFRDRAGVRKSLRLLKRWLEELQTLCGPNLWWFAVRERGRAGDNVHFHVLLMVSNSGILAQTKAMKLWERIAGNIRADFFDPRKDAIDYMLKTFRMGEDFDVDFNLPPVPHTGNSAQDTATVLAHTNTICKGEL